LKMDAVWAGSRAVGAFMYGLFGRWDVVFEGWRDWRWPLSRGPEYRPCV
jgi:hypothetical protein